MAAAVAVGVMAVGRAVGGARRHFRGRMHDLDRRQIGELRNAPRLRTIGDVAVRQKNHRRHEFDGDAHGFLHGVEAVRRPGCGHDRHRAIAIAAKHGEQQIGLFGLGRQTGARAAALHIDDDHRQFGHDAQPHRLSLEADAGTAGGGGGDLAGEGSADDRRHRRDLVLRLEGADVEIFHHRQFVQDVACRGDRITAEEKAFAAAVPAVTRPQAVASLPVILRYLPGASLCAGRGKW